MTQSNAHLLGFTVLVLLFFMPALGCQQSQPVGDEARSEAMQTIVPGLRIAPQRGIVEFDGEVAVDVHHPDTPDVYLELIVTGPNAREHEALIVTEVPASIIHAALLAAGYEPGEPGRFVVAGDRLVREPPAGSVLDVLLVTTDSDGNDIVASPADWMRTEASHQSASSGTPRVRNYEWVFAGSRNRLVTFGDVERLVYDADGTGVIIGLTTFGSELIALREVVSPDSGIDEPFWLGNAKMMPRVGQPVTVRLQPPVSVKAVED